MVARALTTLYFLQQTVCPGQTNSGTIDFSAKVWGGTTYSNTIFLSGRFPDSDHTSEYCSVTFETTPTYELFKSDSEVATLIRTHEVE